MFGKAKTTPSKDPLGDLVRAFDAAIAAARAARVDARTIETAIEQQLAAHRHYLAANLRF